MGQGVREGEEGKEKRGGEGRREREEEKKKERREKKKKKKKKEKKKKKKKKKKTNSGTITCDGAEGREGANGMGYTSDHDHDGIIFLFSQQVSITHHISHIIYTY